MSTKIDENLNLDGTVQNQKVVSTSFSNEMIESLNLLREDERVKSYHNALGVALNATSSTKLEKSTSSPERQNFVYKKLISMINDKLTIEYIEDVNRKRTSKYDRNKWIQVQNAIHICNSTFVGVYENVEKVNEETGETETVKELKLKPLYEFLGINPLYIPICIYWDDMKTKEDLVNLYKELSCTQYLDGKDYKDFFDNSPKSARLLQSFQFYSSTIHNLHSHYGRRGKDGKEENKLETIRELKMKVDGEAKTFYCRIEFCRYMTELVKNTPSMTQDEKLALIFLHQEEYGLLDYTPASIEDFTLE
jgi:hypothetical protein